MRGNHDDIRDVMYAAAAKTSMRRSRTTGEVRDDVRTSSSVSINFLWEICARKRSDAFRSMIAHNYKMRKCDIKDMDGPQGTYSGCSQLRFWLCVPRVKLSNVARAIEMKKTCLNSRLRALEASLALYSFADALSQTSSTMFQSSEAVAVR